MPLSGSPANQKKQIFAEFGAKKLHSGEGGPVVKNPKQAVAIALSTERRAAAKKGRK